MDSPTAIVNAMTSCTEPRSRTTTSRLRWPWAKPYGLTSNDVVDTAQALQVREASRLIEHGLVRFGEVLERRAHEFQHTPQIGRTHGIHAEPITFGLKIANWYSENRRNLLRFGAAAQQM